MRTSALLAVIVSPGAALWLFVCFIRCEPAFALDSQKSLTQYSHETRTNQNGLPGEAVNEILQTPDGYLWLLTSGGLVRFDGVRFVRIEPRVGKEPLGEPIGAICLNVEGQLLIR